ncbi:MAG: hypothetical protein ACJ8ES_10995 [Xanthobacteraceae bacterium]
MSYPAMEAQLAGNAWLAVFASIAGPAAVLAVHAKNWRRDADALTKDMVKARAERADAIREQPKHWSQAFATTSLLGLPVVQFVLYVIYGLTGVVLLPLAVTIPITLSVGLLRPWAVSIQKPDHRQWAVNSGVLAAGLIFALLMPLSGIVAFLRVALSDALAILVVLYILRVHQIHGSRANEA